MIRPTKSASNLSVLIRSFGIFAGLVGLLLVCLNPAFAQVPVSFNAPMSFGAGSAPQSVVVGDFNGDGKLDMAVADYTGGVSVLVGNGDGTFQPAVSYAAGPNPYRVVVGDFNGDGHLDLAVANWTIPSGGSVSVLLGNGDGTFQAAVNYQAGAAPGSIAVGDFNDDGHLDLVLADEGHTGSNLGGLILLFGNGDGTFQSAVNYATVSHPYSLAVGDFNGDGKLDIAVADPSGDVSVLLGNGDGTFQVGASYTPGTGPYTVAVADFNGDGKPDLVIAGGPGGVSILLGNGDGSFQTPVNYTESLGADSVAGAISIAVGDFNGDGHPDLAVTNSSGGVSILLGIGDGTFQLPVSYAANLGSNSIAVGDFNGDGHPDLAVAIQAGDVSVLLNTTPTSGSPRVKFNNTNNPVPAFGKSSLSASMTVAPGGTNTVAFATVWVDEGFGAPGTTFTVTATYGGQPMTSAGPASYDYNYAPISTQVFYLVNPPTGTNILTVNAASSSGTIQEVVANLVSFNGVNQTTPVRPGTYQIQDSPNGDSVGSFTAMLASNANDLTLGAVEATYPFTTPASNQTVDGTDADYFMVGSDHATAGASSVADTWSFKNPWAYYAYVGFSIQAATSGGGGGGTPILTYTATPVSMVYGTNTPAFTGIVTDFTGTDMLANATTGTLAFTTTATSTSGVGSYAINGSGLTANGGKYSFAQAASNATALTITPATPTVIFNVDAVGYGGQGPGGCGGGAQALGVNGNSLVSGTFKYVCTTLAGDPILPVYPGTYNVTATFTSSDPNYSNATGTHTHTILPGSLFYKATPATRAPNTANPLFTGTVYGFAGNDTLASATTGTLTFTSPATASSGPGSYPINGSGLTANNGAYTFYQAPENATALSITGPAIPVMMNNANTPVAAFGQSTLTAPMVVSPGGADTVAFATVWVDEAAGTPGTPTFAVTATLGGQAMTSAGPASYDYNYAPMSSQVFYLVVSGTGTLPLVVNATPSSGTIQEIVANVVTYNNVNLPSPVRPGSYQTLHSANGVSVGNFTATISSNPGDTVLGAVEATYTFATPASNQTVDGIAAAYYKVGSDHAAAGAASVTDTWSFTNPWAYFAYVGLSIESDTSGGGGGTPTLTYTANPVSLTFGSPIPAFTGTVNGFSGTDTQANATTGALTFTTTATSTSGVGSYAINGSGLTANGGKYLFVQNPSNATALTITPATPTVIFNVDSVGYGGQGPGGCGGESQALGVNGSTLVSGTFKYVCTTLAGDPILPLYPGTYNVTATFTSSDPNYSNATGTHTLTILPGVLFYNATPATRASNAANPPFTGTVYGFAGNDTLANATTGTLTFTSSATASSAPGSYAINGSGLTANNGAYTFSQAPGNATALTIAQATPTVIFNVTAIGYQGAAGCGGESQALGVNGNSLVSGTFKYVCTTLAGDPVVPIYPGTYNVTATFTSSDPNYSNATGTSTFTILPGTLTYKATPATRASNAVNPPFTGTVTGFVGNDTLANATTGALTFTSSATASSAPGTYAINGSGLTANNGAYTFSQAPDNATALSITAPSTSIPVTLNNKNAIAAAFGSPTLNAPMTVTAGGTNTVAFAIVWVDEAAGSPQATFNVTATYGGQAMTSAGFTAYDYGYAPISAQVFYLVNPLTGSNTLAVSATASSGTIQEVAANLVSFNNVSQTMPVRPQTYETVSGPSIPVGGFTATISSNSNDLTLGAVEQTYHFATPASNQTVDGTNAAYFALGDDHSTIGAPSVSDTWSFTQPDAFYTFVGFSIQAAQ